MTAARRPVLDRIAEEILALDAASVVRVAIDGIDGAGKTTFADALAELLGDRVIRASADDFHAPRAVRHRRGRASAVGFFHDSYDREALTRCLLDPLSPGGTGRFRRRAFDLHADEPVDAPVETAGPGAVLLVDGLFLHRPELRTYWDYSVFLEVPFQVAFERLCRRDGAVDRELWEQRYLAGQQLYLRECDPARRATRTVGNATLGEPALR